MLSSATPNWWKRGAVTGMWASMETHTRRCLDGSVVTARAIDCLDDRC